MSERERRGAGRDVVPGKAGAGAVAGSPGRTTLVEQAYAIQRKAMGIAPVAGVDAAVKGASSTRGAPVDDAMRARVESATGARWTG